MQLTEEDLNNIAMYGLITGIDPERREKIEACDCKTCMAAAAMLRIAGDRMLLILEAEDATKN